MKKENIDDFQLFYMEIPQADYLNDIDPTIHDEIDDRGTRYDDINGLSAKQVSELAKDTLNVVITRNEGGIFEDHARGDSV